VPLKAGCYKRDTDLLSTRHLSFALDAITQALQISTFYGRKEERKNGGTSTATRHDQNLLLTFLLLIVQ
jgi:hypothetical protein